MLGWVELWLWLSWGFDNIENNIEPNIEPNIETNIKPNISGQSTPCLNSDSVWVLLFQIHPFPTTIVEERCIYMYGVYRTLTETI